MTQRLYFRHGYGSLIGKSPGGFPLFRYTAYQTGAESYVVIRNDGVAVDSDCNGQPITLPSPADSLAGCVRHSQKVRRFGLTAIVLSIALFLLLIAIDHSGWSLICLFVFGLTGMFSLEFSDQLQQEEEVKDARLQGPMALEAVLERRAAEREMFLSKIRRSGTRAGMFANRRSAQQFNSTLGMIGKVVSGNFGEGRRRAKRRTW